jgi:hypothetical protein
VIGLNPVGFGSAPGAPDVATVNDAAGMVELFNSAASRAIANVSGLEIDWIVNSTRVSPAA